MLVSMTTEDTAKRLVEYCRKRRHLVAVEELYSDHCISKEMPGVPNPVVKGKDAIIKKNEDWFAMVSEFHRNEISKPIVTENFFCCQMSLDVTFKESERMVLN